MASHAIINITNRHHGLMAQVESYPNKACALDKMAQEEGYEDFRGQCREHGLNPHIEAAQYEITIIKMLGDDD